jgi:hypothetical protein
MSAESETGLDESGTGPGEAKEGHQADGNDDKPVPSFDEGRESQELAGQKSSNEGCEAEKLRAKELSDEEVKLEAK